MNQLLTEMDGVTSQKMVFFIGATNRPDIIDPALTRPGRLDQLIYIGLPDFEARINVFQACLRKSPVDPDVDYEFLADNTEGYSGADIANICKVAAKTAIRDHIVAERKYVEEKEKKKKDAEDKGLKVEEEEEEPPNFVPYITKAMLMEAVKLTARSISDEDLAQYSKFKREMEKRLGLDQQKNAAKNSVRGAAPRAAAAQPAAANAQPAAQPAANAQPAAANNAPVAHDFADAHNDDDIYDS